MGHMHAQCSCWSRAPEYVTEFMPEIAPEFCWGLARNRARNVWGLARNRAEFISGIDLGSEAGLSWGTSGFNFGCHIEAKWDIILL